MPGYINTNGRRSAWRMHMLRSHGLLIGYVHTLNGRHTWYTFTMWPSSWGQSKSTSIMWTRYLLRWKPQESRLESVGASSSSILFSTLATPSIWANWRSTMRYSLDPTCQAASEQNQALLISWTLKRLLQDYGNIHQDGRTSNSDI